MPELPDVVSMVITPVVAIVTAPSFTPLLKMVSSASGGRHPAGSVAQSVLEMLPVPAAVSPMVAPVLERTTTTVVIPFTLRPEKLDSEKPVAAVAPDVVESSSV
jgi:hypothetical protein